MPGADGHSESAPPELTGKDDAAPAAAPKPDPARPWTPPRGAETFTLKRFKADGGLEQCTFTDTRDGVVRHHHPLETPDGKGIGQEPRGMAAAVILATWGSGLYRSAFHGGGKVAGSPMKFELQHNDFPALPAAHVFSPPTEEEEDEDEEDEEDEGALEEDATSDDVAALRAELAALKRELRTPYRRTSPIAPAPPPRPRPAPPPKPALTVPAGMGAADAMQWFFFWQEKAEADAERRITRIQEEQDRRARDEEERHRRNLEEMDARHRRSLQTERELTERNSKESAAVRELKRDLAELRERDDEPEAEDGNAAIAKDIVKEALPALLAFGREYLETKKKGT